MSGLPLHIVALKLPEKIKLQGLCVRSVLRQVTRRDLMDVGMSMGHAMAVMNCVFPQPVRVVARD